MKSDVCSLSVNVLEAHSLGNTMMFAVKVACKGTSTTVYKSKEDFKSVLNMFRLVGAMCRAKNDRCEVCAECSAVCPVRVSDEESLDHFLNYVLSKLRKSDVAAIEKCSTHRGVVQILMDFLNVRHGRYFCEHTSSSSPQDVLNNDVDHPLLRCSLNRKLSEQFAARDSVC
ncbi:hypothetical protein CCR75_001158 [Bremia lactucae]|uniref:4Fe-4S ferredoxin-type domain-containing protein n=1 Tax=Bremia lactucae TaxID=4779 RepID=A0A976IFL8_BRELC|nr:hypothetical protein CCR75_001158 [Bremia lactucae]